jgi:hypothetical protein
MVCRSRLSRSNYAGADTTVATSVNSAGRFVEPDLSGGGTGTKALMVFERFGTRSLKNARRAAAFPALRDRSTDVFQCLESASRRGEYISTVLPELDWRRSRTWSSTWPVLGNARAMREATLFLTPERPICSLGATTCNRLASANRPTEARRCVVRRFKDQNRPRWILSKTARCCVQGLQL